MSGRSKTPFQKRMRNRKAVSGLLVASMLCTLAPAAVVAAPEDVKWYRLARDRFLYSFPPGPP